MKFKKPLIITLSAMLTLAPLNKSYSSKKRSHLNFNARKNYYSMLLEEGISKKVASLVFNKNFEVYGNIVKPKIKKGSGLTFEKYRRMINPYSKAKIAARFFRDNLPLLLKIEKEYGISPIALSALVSIETSAGTYLGRYKIFNAIFSNYLKRQIYLKKGIGNPKINKKWKRFYLNQLKYMGFLLKVDTSYAFLPSSVAGAFGIVQFMPESYKKFAVDGNFDGKIDLFEVTDALYSAANYLNFQGGRENIYGAVLHYNGHVWFSMVFREIVSLEKEELSNYMQQLDLDQPRHEQNPSLMELLFLRENEFSENNSIEKPYFVSLLDLFLHLNSNFNLFLFPNSQIRNQDKTK